MSKIKSGVDRAALWVKANDRITETLANRSAEATARYHEGYDNAAFVVATAGKSTKYANNLIDAAMALCGDPGYDWPAERRWCDDAWLFLAGFAQEPRTYVCAGCNVEWNRRPVGFVTFAEGRKQVLGLCRVCALGAGPDGELVAELLTYARRLAASRAGVEEDAAEVTFEPAAGSWGGVEHMVLGGKIFRHVRRGDEDAYVEVRLGEGEHPESEARTEEIADEWVGELGRLYGVRRGIARTQAEREWWTKHGWAARKRAETKGVDPCEGCDTEHRRCYTQRDDELDCVFSLVGSERAMLLSARAVAERIVARETG